MNTRWLAGSVAFFSCIALSMGCRQDGTGGMVDADAYDRSAGAIVATESALEVADDVLGFDPVLDRTRSADQNAAAVQTHATDSLTGCGTVSLSGTTVTIDFGSTPCTTPSGHDVSGTLSATIGARSGEATATLAFTSFTIDGTSLSGTLGFSTRLTGLSVDVALTSGTSTVSGTASIGATTGAFTLDATLTTTRGGATTMVSVSGLVWLRGDCYPSAGSVTATTGRLVQSISFSSTTAMSGTVTVTEGPISATETLPAYGDCPAP